MRLAVDTYSVTTRLPSEEKFGLVAQIRRAAYSVPANIAEGSGRGSDREFRRFLDIAYGSLLEVETLVELAAQLKLLKRADCKELMADAGRLGRMLNMLKAHLARRSIPRPDD